jgi:hypothetical protein
MLNIQKCGIYKRETIYGYACPYKRLSSVYPLISIADPDPGSGIQCLFDPGIWDPGWIKKSRSGSGIRDEHLS